MKKVHDLSKYQPIERDMSSKLDLTRKDVTVGFRRNLSCYGHGALYENRVGSGATRLLCPRLNHACSIAHCSNVPACILCTDYTDMAFPNLKSPGNIRGLWQEWHHAA